MTLRSFFSGLWRGLDALRKALHLILLLLLFGVLFGVLRGSVPLVPNKAALVIAPEGPLVEQLSGNARLRALDEALGNGRQEALLWDLTDAIRAAASDRRIPVLALDLDKLESGTQPALAELAAAIREFRASGKKVIAYGVELTQERYYLAAQADEIYLDPMGFVLVQGYDRYRPYLKDVLDKLGVDINVFRVGAFKSAVETFTRTSMSPEDREESRAYLTALWDSYQQAVTKARKLPPDALAKYVDTFLQTVPAAKGDAAKVALSDGLVTGLKTQLEVEQRLTELVGKNDDGDSFSGVASDDYLRVAKAEKRLNIGKQKVGVIVASGRDPRWRPAPGYDRRGLHRAADPRGALRQGGQSARAAGRQSRRQRARLGADLPRTARAACRRQAPGRIHGRLCGLRWLLHLGPGG